MLSFEFGLTECETEENGIKAVAVTCYNQVLTVTGEFVGRRSFSTGVAK